MTQWIIWFEEHQETVGLYKSESGLTLVGHFSLHDIPTQINGEAVIGVFPSEAVSFVKTVLPNTSDKKLRLALPSLVEDSIASNPEDNFYALPKEYKTGEAVMIGVVSLSYINQLLLELNSHEILVESLIPDCFLLPVPKDKPSKMTQHDRVIIRKDESQGFAMQKSHAGLIMQELQSIPESLPCLDAELPFNFLQAQFAPKPPKRSFKPKNTLVVILGGAIVAHLATLVILGAVLNQRLEVLKDKNLSLYAEVFPGAIKVNSPKSLIERELKNSGGLSQDPFISLLATAGDALSLIPNASLEKISYQQHTLNIKLLLPSMDALETIMQSFAQSGVKAQQQQVVEVDNKITVDITLTRGDNS